MKVLTREEYAQVKILEKIKEEIQGLIDFEESCCGNTTLGYECLGIINDRISELKEDKCDNNHDCEHCDWVECPEDFDHEGFYNFLLNTIQPNEMEKYRNMFLSSGEIVN